MTVFVLAKKRKRCDDAAYLTWGEIASEVSGVKAFLGHPTDIRQAYAWLAQLDATLDNVEEDLRSHVGDDADLYAKVLGNLRRAISLRDPQKKWADAASEIAEAELAGLELCAKLLPQEDEVAKDELDEIANAVNELFNQVRESDIKNPLKRWLLELLSSIKKSIDNYYIFGARGFRDTLANVAGEITLCQEVIATIKKADETVWSKLGSIVFKFINLAERAKPLYPLLKWSGELIGIGCDAGDETPT